MSSLDLSSFIHIEGGRYLPHGGFTRNEWMTVNQVNEYRQRHGNVGIFTTAYVYDSQNVSEANLYGDFYLDFDDENNFEAVRKSALDALFYFKQPFIFGIPEKFIRIYFSGKKGLHLIVPAVIMGVEPDKYLNQYYKQIATEIKERLNYATDLKIYDNRRLFRLPNSKHQDTGLYKVPLTVEELKLMDYENILRMAKEPRVMTYERPFEMARAKAEYREVIERWKRRWEAKFSKERRGDAKPFDFVPPCIKDMLNSGPIKGQRNNMASALVSFFKRQGQSEQEVWDHLVEWNQGSLTDRELRSCLHSVFHGDYEYGCSTLEVLSTCYDDCPIKAGRGKK